MIHRSGISIVAVLLLSLVVTTGCDTTALTPMIQEAVTSLVQGAVEEAINPTPPTYNSYNLPQTYDPQNPLNNLYDPSTLLNTNDPTNPVNGPTSSVGSGT